MHALIAQLDGNSADKLLASSDEEDDEEEVDESLQEYRDEVGRTRQQVVNKMAIIYGFKYVYRLSTSCWLLADRKEHLRKQLQDHGINDHECYSILCFNIKYSELVHLILMERKCWRK